MEALAQLEVVQLLNVAFEQMNADFHSSFDSKLAKSMSRSYHCLVGLRFLITNEQ